MAVEDDAVAGGEEEVAGGDHDAAGTEGGDEDDVFGQVGEVADGAAGPGVGLELIQQKLEL